MQEAIVATIEPSAVANFASSIVRFEAIVERSISKGATTTTTTTATATTTTSNATTNATIFTSAFSS